MAAEMTNRFTRSGKDSMEFRRVRFTVIRHSRSIILPAAIAVERAT